MCYQVLEEGLRFLKTLPLKSKSVFGAIRSPYYNFILNRYVSGERWFHLRLVHYSRRRDFS